MHWLVLLIALQAQPEAGQPAAPAGAAQGQAGEAGTPDGDPKAADAAGEDTPAADGADAAAAGEDGETAADAEDSTSADDEGGILQALDELLNSGALGLMREGGFFMWPILLMAILGTGVIIERYRSLQMLSTDSSAIRQQVQKLLEADRVEEALNLCDREQGPVPAVLSAGLRKYLILRRLQYDAGRIEQQVVKGMEDYAVHIVAALERHLPILATISSVAPMLGFLGTVQGMIFAFKDIVEKMGEMNIVEAAAGGIQVSLLTTCFGLIVGIPAYIAFNYFTSIINRFVLEVEESATELIESVTLQMALNQRDSSS